MNGTGQGETARAGNCFKIFVPEEGKGMGGQYLKEGFEKMGDSEACLSIAQNDPLKVRVTHGGVQREIICKSNNPGKLRKNGI